jgi:hypothetical protein
MKIEVKRFYYGDKHTIGKLFVDGQYLCYTLEDKMRQEADKPVSEWKVYSQTAIPTGDYRVMITLSNRFKKVLPILLNVDGFSGVRIHAGNSSADTEGCILVGMNWDGKSDFIANSRVALNFLIDKKILII